MSLKVTKSDGSAEVYLHTKVMGSISAAMGDSGFYQEGMTEHLAEAVTEYIVRRYGSASVGTDEIHAMIEAVLSETGYYEAALALHEHRLTRQIKRCRTEVIHHRKTGQNDPSMSDTTQNEEEEYLTQPWNKSNIINVLETEYGLESPLARAVAGAVEEKVLRMGCRRVFASLVRAMVENDLWAMKQAEQAFVKQAEEESKLYATLRDDETLRAGMSDGPECPQEAARACMSGVDGRDACSGIRPGGAR